MDNTARGVVLKTSEAINLAKLQSDTVALTSLFSTILKHEPNLYSLYLVSADDHAFQMVNLNSPSIREKLAASKHERWLTVEHSGLGSERISESTYLDKQLTPVRTVVEPSNFKPSQRKWFKNAHYNSVHRTDPYLFHHVKINGISYATKIDNSELVLGADLSLITVQSLLHNDYGNQALRSSYEAYLFLSDGRLVATNQQAKIINDLPVLPPLALPNELKTWVTTAPKLKVSSSIDWEPFDFAISGQPHGYAIDLLELIADLTGLEFDYVNGQSWEELIEQFKLGDLDILHSVAAQYHQTIPDSYGLEFYRSPYAIAQLHKSPYIIDSIQLAPLKIGVNQGWTNYEVFQKALDHSELILEPDLNRLLDQLENGQIDGILNSEVVLKRKIQTANIQGMEINSISPTLIDDQYYLLTDPNNQPLQQVLQLALNHIGQNARDYLKAKWGGEKILYTHVPHSELLNLASQSQLHGQLHEFVKGDTDYYLYIDKLNTQPIQTMTVLMPKDEVMAAITQRSIYILVSSLAILSILVLVAWLIARPIVKPIKALEQQANLISKRHYHEVKKVHSNIDEVAQLSKAFITMSKSLQRYEQEQRNFIDSFIKLVADAIDDKSHYTGAHCLRVPEIGLMLAEEAHKIGVGHFANFHFKNEDEWREFRISAWLHDCGKITTPEYVVDKGTKLETNYNRIHEIRTRFEVLWRDAEIDALKAINKNPHEQQQIDAKLSARQSELLQQFDFVASSNIGSEFMADEDIAKITEIGKQTWLRHFDETKGLSPFERQRYNNTKQTLPSEEPLLSNKPQHIIHRDIPYRLDPKFGINMDVPDYLYNYGELYNLSIRRGTLTFEERFKINEHMISGIKMLDNIPFPEELKRVPQYASTHHETLKGTGYPRKLKADDLSIPERILAVSDVFEALTAADRPYKPAKNLKQALDIMYYMVLDEHLDKEVFQLFIESGVYLKYGQRYLTSEQLVDVDISQYNFKRKVD
ncbi:HD domain-containing phosphohydrolase [Vibrio fluminensis]|uniref:HD domain-containing phosphohydrolase n=1 Tax=Vibrio fluminensis TaxID=2783614 RepID=UPI001888D29A|nr:HD domain-containing phosphohydrolase [Vibrio fluminensis]